MSYDGFVLRSVLNEWQEKLVGGRITKIKQPSATDIYMTIRNQRQNITVLLSIHPSFARMHESTSPAGDHQEPPMFCRMLRKHLEGGFIKRIEQTDLERVATFTIESTDEIGDREEKKLIAEIMGKHSNLVLVAANGTIIDAIKHISPAVNRHRTLLPGQTYTSPPQQEKQNPLSAMTDDVYRAIDWNSGKIDKQLVSRFSGMSPLLAKEIVERAGIGDRSTLAKSFLDMMETLKTHTIQPTIHQSPQNKEYFYLLPLSHIGGEMTTFTSTNEMIAQFYSGKAERDRVKQQAHDLERFLKTQRQKNERKKKKLQQTEQSSLKGLENQKLGELLTAHMHLMKLGNRDVEVVDYYDPEGQTLTIALNPEKSPADNAQHYFKLYNKAKSAQHAVKEQLKQTDEEILYFDNLIQQMDYISQHEVQDIRDELEEEGYLKQKHRGKKKNKPQKPKPERYESSEGIEIFVGKNNKQNEFLTMRFSNRNDTWLHTKDIPGSHVVIRSDNFQEETLHEAAQLAAYFSKARESGSVPVDYTLIRHVKKPSGAKPGFVTYDEQKTLFVTPEEHVVRKLKK